MRLRSFSLRTGLVVFLLITIALGVTGRWAQEVRRRGDAQRRVIAKCDASSRRYSDPRFQRATETQSNGFTETVRQWVHPEYARACAELRVTGPMLEDEALLRDIRSLFRVESAQIGQVYRPQQLAALFSIPGMKRLTLSGHLIAEDDATDWSAVRLAKDLETFECSNAYLSDPLAREIAKLPNLQNALDLHCSLEALAAIAEAPNLTTLSTSGGQARYIIENDNAVMSEAEEKAYLQKWAKIIFARLANRDRLTSLSLRYSLYLEKEDLEDFCTRSPVTELTLLDAHLSPGCLAQFARLPKLKTLFISEDLIEDSHLPALAGAHQLQEISIRGATTLMGVEKLRALLPNTLINGARGPSPGTSSMSTANQP